MSFSPSKRISEKSSSILRKKKTAEYSMKRSVSFNTKVKRYSTKLVYSEEDIAALWYSETEMELIISEIKDIVMMMMMSKKGNSRLMSTSGEGLCTRGLEDTTREGSLARQSRKDLIRDSVLNFQDTYCVAAGENFHEKLARISKARSRTSRTLARTNAMLDEACVRNMQSRTLPIKKREQQRPRKTRAERTQSAWDRMLQSQLRNRTL